MPAWANAIFDFNQKRPGGIPLLEIGALFFFEKSPEVKNTHYIFCSKNSITRLHGLCSWISQRDGKLHESKRFRPG